MNRITQNIYSNEIGEFKRLLEGAGLPDSRTAGLAKVGVIFEGGALRGVLSCGYGRALKEFLPDTLVFSLFGSSSGALNSVYYATNQLDLAHSIYVENATDKRCTNLRRFPNILDVDWLLDNWIFGAKRFNISKLRSSIPHVIISLTRMQDGGAKYVDAVSLDEAVLNKAMKATSYAPLLTNATQIIDGVECGDGAIADAIPYQKAIDDGCTHVICLVTRPPQYRKGEGNFFGKWFKRLRLARQTEAYRDAYWKNERKYNSLLESFYQGSLSIPTMVICPASPSELPHNIETNPKVIDSMGITAYKLAKTQLAEIFPNLKP